jgi:putative hydrolase
MKIKGDYHMHSKFSGDSNNDLEDIVLKAIDLGLEEIAITDHGPAHTGYGVKKEAYQTIRQEIDRLNEKYPQISVLLGIEANILGVDGKIDLDEDMRSMNDWVNAGYHFGSNLKEDYKIHLTNILSKFSKRFYNKAKETNTKAMVNAMKNNKINMITHPGAKGPIDVSEVAKAASETGTMLEINNSHGHLTVEEIKIAAQYPVVFVVNSDAHKIENIGKVENSIGRVLSAGLDIGRVFNLKVES